MIKKIFERIKKYFNKKKIGQIVNEEKFPKIYFTAKFPKIIKKAGCESNGGM